MKLDGNAYVIVDCPECGLPVAFALRGVLVGNRVLIGVVSRPSTVCGHDTAQHRESTMGGT